MNFLIQQYQQLIGWNDHSIICILCDYIEAIRADPNAPCLQDYLEQRANEEEQLINQPY